MSIWTKEKERQEDITDLKSEIKKELIRELRYDLRDMFASVISDDHYEYGGEYALSEAPVKKFRDKLSASLVEVLDESVKSKANELVRGEEFLDALVKRLKDKQL